MIDKTLFLFFLTKLNDTSINTQGVEFKGNYVFVRINDAQQFLSTSSYNAYDTEETNFTALAEVISNEEAFVENNNRSGWTKQYAFQFDIRDKDENLAALQELRDYLRANSTQTIVDDDTTYKMSIKVTRPIFAGNQQGAGTVFPTYVMTMYADTLETGFFGNEATHTMREYTTLGVDEITVGETYEITTLGTTDWEVIFGETELPYIVGYQGVAESVGTGTGEVTTVLQSAIFDQVTVSSATTTNPSNLLTENSNTKHQPVARGVSINFVLNYDGSLLNQAIRRVVEGKQDRETIFVYRKVFDGDSDDYNITITGGSVVYKNGVVVQINFNGVEINV